MQLVADRVETGARALLVLVAARRTGHPDCSQKRIRRLNLQRAAHHGHARQSCEAWIEHSILDRSRELRSVATETNSGPGLAYRGGVGRKPGIAVPKQNLRFAEAINHRDRNLIAIGTTLLERCAGSYQRDVRRQ